MSNLIERLRHRNIEVRAEAAFEAADALEAKDAEIADLAKKLADMSAYANSKELEIQRLKKNFVVYADGEYLAPGECGIGKNPRSWYESACYWRKKSERMQPVIDAARNAVWCDCAEPNCQHDKLQEALAQYDKEQNDD